MAGAGRRAGRPAAPHPPSFGGQAAASDTWDGDTDPRHHVYAYWGRTSELLDQPGVWLAIWLVAAALLRERTLSGGQVRAIIEAAGVEPDHERVPLFAPSDEDDDDDGEAFSWERW